MARHIGIDWLRSDYVLRAQQVKVNLLLKQNHSGEHFFRCTKRCFEHMHLLNYSLRSELKWNLQVLRYKTTQCC